MFHIVNQELSLEGDPKAIAEFKAFVKGEVRARKGRAWPGENVIPFSCNRIIPKPVRFPRVKNMPFNSEKVWAMSNWNTLREPFDFSEWNGDRLRFCTVLCEIAPVIKQVSALFPTVKITHTYVWRMWRVGGKVVYQNGKALKEKHIDDPRLLKAICAELDLDEFWEEFMALEDCSVRYKRTIANKLRRAETRIKRLRMKKRVLEA